MIELEHTENIDSLEEIEIQEEAPKENTQEIINSTENKINQIEQDITNSIEKVLDIEPFIDEFSENGSLSDESYEKISKAGISKEIVDLYIEGQKAIIALKSQEIMNIAGSPENYQKMILWAAENISEEEKDAFNEAVSSQNKSMAILAVEALKAKYMQAMPNNSKLIEADNGYHLDTYSSMAEMVRDVRDERYKEDEAYRKMVAEKASRSFKSY